MINQPTQDNNATHLELIGQAQHALNQADFASARKICDTLIKPDADNESRLFALSTTIRIDAYEETSRPIAGDLAQLELLRARFNADDYWPQHWYLMGWLTAPLLDIHPIDPFYLYYRCNDLPEVADREECLCQAMQYAVLYSEHCFITQLNKDYPFDSSWLVSTYHRAMIEALRAAYSRDGDGLHSQIEGLKRAAGNPRQWREVEIMERRYSHYMA